MIDLKEKINRLVGVNISTMFTVEENYILEDILNEEILEYLHSGYNVQDDYVQTLRGMIKKLGLEERYNFNDYIKAREKYK
jgi:hypothetical protein